MLMQCRALKTSHVNRFKKLKIKDVASIATTKGYIPGRGKMHPQKFALLIGCASMMMMFVAFTSALIVRQAQGNWMEFQVPSVFYVSTGVILLSSVTMQLAYTGFLRGKENVYKGLLILTGVLGLAFVYLQYTGWLQMNDAGIFLDGNPSGSFVYVITASHAAHLLAGVTTVLMALLHAFILPYKVTPRRKHRFELVLWFWHFVDFLWIYLFVLFLMAY